MKTFIYDLFPEAATSNGRFISKEGTVAELIIDTGMLTHADHDKVIPGIDDLNKMLLRGNYPRAGEWEPFELDKKEYDELVLYLCSLKTRKPYRTDD
jgi:hypothetical protein